MKLKSELLLGTAIVLGLSGALSGAALAADLYVPPPAAPVAAVAPATNWDGLYIGASVGYGWGNGTDNYSFTSGASTGASTANLSGALIGGQIGYNFHLSDNIVAGIEGNVDWLNETGSATPHNSVKIDWEGSIRGRLGVDMGQILPYVEAGVAFANSTASSTSGFSVSNVHTRWTVGAGVEFMLAQQLSANVEYRYSDYGTRNYTTSPTFSNNIHLTDSTIRLGLNYHF